MGFCGWLTSWTWVWQAVFRGREGKVVGSVGGLLRGRGRGRVAVILPYPYYCLPVCVCVCVFTFAFFVLLIFLLRSCLVSGSFVLLLLLLLVSSYLTACCPDGRDGRVCV